MNMWLQGLCICEKCKFWISESCSMSTVTDHQDQFQWNNVPSLDFVFTFKDSATFVSIEYLTS